RGSRAGTGRPTRTTCSTARRRCASTTSIIEKCAKTERQPMAAKKYDMTILGRPTTVANYSLKAECYGFALRQYTDNWPFLTNVKGQTRTPDFAAWDPYSHTFLRGFPVCYKMFREWKLKHYNVPEERPELFDTAYMPPTHKLVEPLPPFHHVEPET